MIRYEKIKELRNVNKKMWQTLEICEGNIGVYVIIDYYYKLIIIY